MTEATERKMAEPNSPAFREDRAMTTNQREEERREIEITPEMISAGVRVLCRYSDRDDPEIVAVHVFQAMADAIEAGQHLSTKGESNG
jgi:hypothetical protein